MGGSRRKIDCSGPSSRSGHDRLPRSRIATGSARRSIDGSSRDWKSKELHPVRPADRRTLIRRATFDLTGLPPTSEEVDAFLADASPDAFARVVDRLLASPAYGEQWGRQWLDVVRYADTAGETADYPVREAYKYRNYVISAFNQDMPYDEFVREQVAGDIMAEKLRARRTPGS